YLPCHLDLESGRTGEFSPVRARSGTETILVVEDEPGVRALASAALSRQGYTVLEAGQGSEALDLCARYTGVIHLVLTDLVMPGMSGRQMAGQLATIRPNAKVVYMSGYTDDVAVRHGLVGPSFAYLQKPFSLAALTQKVREV